MKLYPTKDFIEWYESLPQRIQKQADKQLGLLLQNLHEMFSIKKHRTKKSNLRFQSFLVLDRLFKK